MKIQKRIALGQNDPNMLRWDVTVNGESFNYGEGLGHYFDYNCSRLTDKGRDDLHQDLKSLLLNQHKYNGHGMGVLGHPNLNISCTKRITSKARQVKFHKLHQLPKPLTVVPPEDDDILYALNSDAQVADYTFEDFCDNYGYESDSIKALEIYNECVKTRAKLLRAGLNLQELQEKYHDY